MWYAVSAIAGLVVGAVIGALVTLLKTRRGDDRAVAAETRAAEFDRLLNIERQEKEALRNRVEQTRELESIARTRLEEAEKSFENQKVLLAKSQQDLRETFTSLAGEALKSNRTEFLSRAQDTMKQYIDQAKTDLEKRQASIDSLVKPLGEALKNFDSQARQLESQRSKEQGELKPYLASISKETRDLVEALRKPQIAGHWGELQLQRIVEVAGLSRHTRDFDMQVSKQTEDGLLRPDLIVELPGSLSIVIDAKCPIDAFVAVQSKQTPEEREAAMGDFTRRVRDRLRELSSKKYWAHFGPSPEFVVMFLPGESLYRAALDHDPDLMELGVSEKVMLASPMTLLALMKTVAYSWQQQEMAENAREISEAGRDLYERIRKWVEHLAGLRKSIKSTVDHFDNSIGSLNRMVLPKARTLKELGAGSGEDIESIDPIGQEPRELPTDSDAPAESSSRPALPGGEDAITDQEGRNDV